MRVAARPKTVSPWDSAVSPRKTNKRKGSNRCYQAEQGDSKNQTRVDVNIIFAEDTAGWDTYLIDFLNYFQEEPAANAACASPSPRKLNIRCDELESVNLKNISALDAKAISNARATLIILSPAFINYIETHADVYELCKLLKPANTIAMLCGVSDKDIISVHRAALVSYDAWPRLVAKNTDNEFVLSLVQSLQEVLAKSHESAKLINKFNLKLTPRKVKEGHNKVFLLLEQPLDHIHRVQVFLEGDGVREVQVKQRNPYTLQFVVPDAYLKVSKILNVHIRCQGRLLGVLPLKVESLMGELSAILSAVDSPYELLCRTLGLDSRHQVDAFLTDRFRQRTPRGFDSEWITPPQLTMDKTTIKEELPTLLHFSACYGLKSFTRLLLDSPGGNTACTIKNAKGLTPSQLANYAGHNDLASLLHDAEKGQQPKKLSYENLVAATACWSIDNQSYVNMPSESECSGGSFQIPESENLNTTREEECQSQFSPTKSQTEIPPPWEETQESHYLSMQPIKSPSQSPGGPLLPHERMLEELMKMRDSCNDQERDSYLSEINEPSGVEPIASSSTCCSSECFTNSQNELAKILESFKQGRSIEEIEKEVHEWKRKNSKPLQEDEESLNLLRQEYEKKISEKSPKSRKKCFLDIKGIFPNKVKQDKKKTQGMVNSPSNTSLSSMENVETNPAGKKSPKINSRKPLPVPRTTLSLEDFDPSRPNSTISSSGSRASTASNLSNLSAGSVYDSGNQTDSCDELNTKKPYVNQSIIQRTLLNLKPNSLNKYSSKPMKAPAPPPRIRRSPNCVESVEEHYSHPRHSFDTCANFANQCPTQSPENRISQQGYVSPDFAVACFHRFKQNQSVPNLCKAQSNQSLNPSRVSASSCYDEDCYWIPPPPIPVYRKTSAPTLETSPRRCVPELDYDMPKPSVIFTPPNPKCASNAFFPDQECHYYSIPRSVQTVETSHSLDDIPSEAPPPPPPV